MEGVDFSALTSGISATTVVAGIAAIAAVKVVPKFAAWGYGAVMKMLGR